MNNEQIEPKENEYEQTIKVSVTFTGFVSVWKKIDTTTKMSIMKILMNN